MGEVLANCLTPSLPCLPPWPPLVSFFTSFCLALVVFSRQFHTDLHPAPMSLKPYPKNCGNSTEKKVLRLLLAAREMRVLVRHFETTAPTRVSSQWHHPPEKFNRGQGCRSKSHRWTIDFSGRLLVSGAFPGMLLPRKACRDCCFLGTVV